MRRLCFVFLVVSIQVVLSVNVWAASEQAKKLRGDNGLSPYAPAERFLGGNFVADEVEPRFIFGKVSDFVKTRSCPTSWFIEEGEKKRIETNTPQSGPVEYTLYLEEDCGGKVTYYVFVDRSQASGTQWMEWRKQFHKSKTEPQYGAVKAALDQASQNGFSVEGELRFVEIDGKLQVKKPEDTLTGELRFQPIYDLKQGKAVAP
ncbi:MAG TPA: hypothetical protein DEO88_15180 [Syntrophobacteraceae bacterium]|nr:hypothetical protein [Syntrophobacteraceae bacterium]